MKLRIDSRHFRYDDLKKIKEWVYDPEISRNFRFTAHIKDDNDLKRFIKSQIKRSNKDNFINLALFDRSDKNETYIGSVGLKKIDLENKNAELTIVIGNKDYRGRGYGQEALYVICRYGFKNFKLRKIYLHVISHNISAIKAYEKFGFHHEGIKRDHIFQNNKFYDEIIMGIIVNEFKNKYGK